MGISRGVVVVDRESKLIRDWCSPLRRQAVPERNLTVCSTIFTTDVLSSRHHLAKHKNLLNKKSTESFALCLLKI